MTLLLRLTGELLLSAVVWLGLLAAIATIAAMALHAALGGGPFRPRYLIAAITGAALAVALAHRLGVPDPLTVSVGRRDLLVVWALAGALAGATVMARRERGTPDSAPVADPTEAPAP